jgi:cation:H+ antiporter
LIQIIRAMILPIVLLLIGFVLLVFGAEKLVEAASALAANFGIPNIVIGLTIVAFGTSAPELVVNIFAAVSGSSEMVMGNVLGSNIFNVLGILGISALIYPLTVKSNTTWIEIPLSLLAAVLIWVMANDMLLDFHAGNLISRSDGLILILFFTVFLVYNITVSKSSSDRRNCRNPIGLYHDKVSPLDCGWFGRPDNRGKTDSGQCC